METERNEQPDPAAEAEAPATAEAPEVVAPATAEAPEVVAPAAAEAPEGAAEATAEAPVRREGGDARPAATEERRRPRGRRRRVCIMCADKIKYVDYKNVSFLRRFVSDRGRIETRRKSSACAKHQRALAAAIKRARHLALLPYTAEQIRGSGISHR
jgi:small subunit ribosomal protein S18